MTAADLRAKLEAVQTTGVAYMTRTVPEPAASVAAPIFDRAGVCVAAISALGADGSLDTRMLEPRRRGDRPGDLGAISNAAADNARTGPRRIPVADVPGSTSRAARPGQHVPRSTPGSVTRLD